MKQRYKISSIIFITLSTLWGLTYLVTFIYSNRSLIIPEIAYLMVFVIGILFHLFTFVPHIFIIVSSLSSNNGHCGLALGLDLVALLFNLLLTPTLWLFNTILNIGNVHFVDHLWILYISFVPVIIAKIIYDIVEMVRSSNRTARSSQNRYS